MNWLQENTRALEAAGFVVVKGSMTVGGSCRLDLPIMVVEKQWSSRCVFDAKVHRSVRSGGRDM